MQGGIQTMYSDAAKRPSALSDTQQVTRRTGTLLSQRIWIPKLLYVALPYFYLVSGIAALIATLYIGSWIWVLPHYLLFSAVCLHMGLLIYRRRLRSDNDGDRARNRIQ
jgi:Flp pilus assembly protein TadB